MLTGTHRLEIVFLVILTPLLSIKTQNDLCNIESFVENL